MSNHAWLLLGLYLVILLALVKPLGIYIADVMEGRGLALRFGGGVESAIYRLCGVKKDEEMGWLKYAWPSCSSTCSACLRSMPCSGCNSGCR